MDFQLLRLGTPEGSVWGNHVKNFFPSVAYFRSNMYNDMPNMVNH